jgi:hypothetical protein
MQNLVAQAERSANIVRTAHGLEFGDLRELLTRSALCPGFAVRRDSAVHGAQRSPGRWHGLLLLVRNRESPTRS